MTQAAEHLTRNGQHRPSPGTGLSANTFGLSPPRRVIDPHKNRSFDEAIAKQTEEDCPAIRVINGKPFEGLRADYATQTPPPAEPLSEEERERDRRIAQEQAFAYAKVEEVKDLTAQIAHLEAQRLRAIADLHATGSMTPRKAGTGRNGRLLKRLTRDQITASELAPILHLRDRDLDRLIETAVSLKTRLPKTLTRLSEGGLDLDRVKIIQEITDPLADDHEEMALAAGKSLEEAEQAAKDIAGKVEDWILRRASTQKPDNLRECLHRAVNRFDPDYADRHAKDNLKTRRVTHRTHRGQATGDIYAHLGAAEALAIYTIIDTYARATRQQGSKRTLDELRADALTHLVVHGHLPDSDTPINLENATIVPDYDPATGELYPRPPHPPHHHHARYPYRPGHQHRSGDQHHHRAGHQRQRQRPPGLPQHPNHHRHRHRHQPR